MGAFLCCLKLFWVPFEWNRGVKSVDFRKYGNKGLDALTSERVYRATEHSTRVSACGLFHTAYPSASEMLKTELRSIYSQLCQDDMPMVRRSAATNLGKFAATVEPAHLKTDVMSIFEDLTQDGNLNVDEMKNGEEGWIVVGVDAS
ncbi:Serine/threonine-protein phosphatase 2A 65 kDa regulatory subunit A beta isoform [Camellia lanceoleosa]|uniref:Serine/threonine-protein phosphatase 2A 65 kDa regulatory subunit A beta isoform n=1 Tax=Camellia lanceoleosa TaxID=1840588 RepID=A0ACC0FFA9_9ERIC|nr:Serine/threonine-protein phosphatase 2A 65 kDa regulatory subunit A beta isoform [Camellia lanceoleosa]